jgi:hypothetical protein
MIAAARERTIAQALATAGAADWDRRRRHTVDGGPDPEKIDER